MSKARMVAVGKLNPENADALQHYVENVVPMLLGAGGEVICRLKNKGVVSGTGDAPETIFMMDFASEEKIREVFDSEQYKALIPVRNRAFREINILVAEEF